MRNIFYSGLFIANVILVAQAGTVPQARYFFSTAGLSDPSDTDSAAVFPTGFGTDPIIDNSAGPAATTRLYLWIELLQPDTLMLGADIAFRTTGNLTIESTNIWQNELLIPGLFRWVPPGGLPGIDSIDQIANSGIPAGAYGSQLVNVSPFFRSLEGIGISNRPISMFDDQWVDAAGSAVVGWVDIKGNAGDVHIIHEELAMDRFTGGPNPNPNAIAAFAGFADQSGGPAYIPGTFYDSPTPEATIIPEPGAGLAFACAIVGLIRSRSRHAA